MVSNCIDFEIHPKLKEISLQFIYLFNYFLIFLLLFGVDWRGKNSACFVFSYLCLHKYIPRPERRELWKIDSQHTPIVTLAKTPFSNQGVREGTQQFLLFCAQCPFLSLSYAPKVEYCGRLTTNGPIFTFYLKHTYSKKKTAKHGVGRNIEKINKRRRKKTGYLPT